MIVRFADIGGINDHHCLNFLVIFCFHLFYIYVLLRCEALQNVRTPFIDLINNNNYNFKHLDIREQFIWLMSNEDNFIINQLSDMILKLHSSRNDIIQN